MKKNYKISSMVAAIILAVGLPVYAGQLNGRIGFSGTVNLDDDSAGTANAVAGWHFFGNSTLLPYVSIADGDFSSLLIANATSFSPWSFSSGSLPAMWSVGGFTFDLDTSSVTFQSPPTFDLNGVPQDGSVSVSGTGIISGNGFDRTPAAFSFTTQDPSTANASGPRSFSFSASWVCEPGNPELKLIKSASPTNAAPGQAVTYYYAITNIGGVTITNINISDDNGTPNDQSDDFNVNPAPFSLTPGQGTVYVLPSISEPMCFFNGSSNLFAGTLTVNVLANGDVEVFYMQSQNLNDNRYGTGATAASGWPNGHKFGDLTGSDEADFLFTDGNGTPVLQFQCDYISAATSATFSNGVTVLYPSGYGTLGPLGGDGTMQIGSKSNVLSCSTTLSDTLNQPGFTGFTANSPPETSPLSNVSIPPGWNYTDGYHVIVSHNAFGAAGFGTVTIPYVHNSPAKTKPDKATPTNVCDCVINTAVATAYAIDGSSSNLIASTKGDPDAVAQVCFTNQSSSGSACNITVGQITTGPGGFVVPLKNNGSGTITVSELDLNTWPAVNGSLTKVLLNNKVIWQGTANQPAALAPNKGTTADRSIPKGKTFNLKFQFQHAPNNTISSYSGAVLFGPSCVISFP